MECKDCPVGKIVDVLGKIVEHCNDCKKEEGGEK